MKQQEKEAIIEWIKNPKRMNSVFAFTAGDLRDITFEIELMLSRLK